MVIAGTINRVAFYCRVNHRDRDYEKYLDDVMRRLEEEHGKQKCEYYGSNVPLFRRNGYR